MDTLAFYPAGCASISSILNAFRNVYKPHEMMNPCPDPNKGHSPEWHSGPTQSGTQTQVPEVPYEKIGFLIIGCTGISYLI